MKIRFLTVMMIMTCVNLRAQFPGPAGTAGSTAIHKDSSVFVNWASGCTVTRGYQDIADPDAGYASFGESAFALGKAANDVVSLGDGGSAVLTFPAPVTNGPGFDFAVFENAFIDAFLELAFVEVSSDGVHFFRFPAVSHTQTDTQTGPFDNTGDPALLHNLAGKYRVNYGTPFDLEELKDEPGLNVDAVTHVKIIDVVGSIDPAYARYDVNNNPINDPYPTPFASGGFDLDAVGVIHQLPLGVALQHSQSDAVLMHPNPAAGYVSVTLPGTRGPEEIVLISMSGQVLRRTEEGMMPLNGVPPGMYLLRITDHRGAIIHKKLLKQ